MGLWVAASHVTYAGVGGKAILRAAGSKGRSAQESPYPSILRAGQPGGNKSHYLRWGLEGKSDYLHWCQGEGEWGQVTLPTLGL